MVTRMADTVGRDHKDKVSQSACSETGLGREASKP
jgi:hypothetical protein